jgi:hypothetical protein
MQTWQATCMIESRVLVTCKTVMLH